MRKGFLAIAALVLPAIVGGIWSIAGRAADGRDTPRQHVPRPVAHVDHAPLLSGPFPDGPAVTRACLNCHPNSAEQVMRTGHWTWAGQKAHLPGAEQTIAVGKRNLLNNFCIHAGPNIEKCASCHAGYGWKDNTFDFGNPENVDCLVCHEQTGTYQKGLAGYPEQGVDLLTVAKSVGRPMRKNCGECHFKGGGGDAVKHGDMDSSMFFPSKRIDVHMGRENLQCVDCHRTRDHDIPGTRMALLEDKVARVQCTDCHHGQPHRDARLDFHTRAVACQTCHIPRMAIDAPTKMYWDWSEAGKDGRPEDPHVYLKGKGSFQYAQGVRPEYYWYNGTGERYLTGQRIDPSAVVPINRPLGGPRDPGAKIWPFKVHRGKQIYDVKYKHLLTPQTWGKGGYWTEFNWDKACRLGSQATGLPYSGEYGFVETVMYWPLSHMVQSADKALQCVECHSPNGVLDWQSLGYPRDPAFRPDNWIGADRFRVVRQERPGKAAEPEPLKLNLSPGSWRGAATGMVFSPQRIADSAMNVAGKSNLTRPWDVHAQRLLECASCHPSMDRPAKTLTTLRVPLEGVGRRAGGGPTSGERTWRCEDCHRAEAAHDWLPYQRAHFARLSCETCHIAEVHAPALRTLDWTMLDARGEPRAQWNGLDGDPRDPLVRITGFRPTMATRPDADGRPRYTPVNVVTTVFWKEEVGEGGGPRRFQAVPHEVLRKAFLADSTHHPEILKALDRDGDGTLGDAELVLDSPEKIEAARRRLAAVGVVNPEIAATLEQRALHHGVGPKRTAVRTCESCHGPDSILSDPAGAGIYVFGHSRWRWIDVFGVVLVGGVVLSAGVHAGLRVWTVRRRGSAERPGDEVALDEPLPEKRVVDQAEENGRE